MSELAQIGVTGLAVMGRNLARNFARHGHRVAIHNRTYARTQALLAEHGDDGEFVPSESMADFVASLERPRRIIVMVKAGPGTDAVIEELVPFLEEDDIIIDARNAHFPDTIRREKQLQEKGLHFVGTGVSGGEEGALNGPSIMPGGSPKSYESLGPLLESISAKVDGSPCCTHVGPNGAGHFVKMVHNGIEYADMQLIAEAYDLIRQGTGASAAEIGEIFTKWNSDALESYLIEITAEVLGHVDADTGKAFVDIVLDEAEQKGTGRWTVQNALDLGVPITGIAEATFARALSGSVPQRKAARASSRLARRPGKSSTTPPSWRTSDGRSTRPRSSHTPRASTRSPPPASSTAGISTGLPWHGYGGAAASSAPASSTASPRRTSGIRTCHCCWPTATSPTPWAPACGGSSPVLHGTAYRHQRSPLRWPTTTASAPSVCRRR